ncbi:MAG: class I SAM-dependent methyltransferase [Acidobacteriota bacterium]|nr:MAG: class I SAM-dependent methyltransferase [Acidobacteriota bacterium]
MSSFYLGVYQRFPEFLKRRINPLEYGVRAVVEEAVLAVGSGRILDAGAGEGRFRAWFPSAQYIGLDRGIGDESWDYSGIDVIGDLQRIPFATATVDSVLNLQVLEHVEDPGQVIQEFGRVLRPGGTLFLTAPQGWHEHQQPNDFYRFTRFALEKMFREAGFEQFEIEPIGGYFDYLGNRLTFIPKVVFPSLHPILRVLLFPVELLCLVFFCFLLPVLCHALDRFDKKKEFTLCYRCRAQK